MLRHWTAPAGALALKPKSSFRLASSSYGLLSLIQVRQEHALLDSVEPHWTACVGQQNQSFQAPSQLGVSFRLASSGYGLLKFTTRRQVAVHHAALDPKSSYHGRLNASETFRLASSSYGLLELIIKN